MDVRLYWTDGRSSWPYAEFLCGDAKWPNRYCASTRPDWHGVLGLSAYTITSKKDFSFMRNFLFAGLIIVIVAALINIFVGSTVAHLAISSVSALVFRVSFCLIPAVLCVVKKPTISQQRFLCT